MILRHMQCNTILQEICWLPWLFVLAVSPGGRGLYKSVNKIQAQPLGADARVRSFLILELQVYYMLR